MNRVIQLVEQKKKPSTIEVLEELEKEIDALEQRKRGNLETQRRLIGRLLLYSFLLYALGLCLFYFYYLPPDWPNRLKYSAPLLVFPVLIYGVKRFLHWYFVRRITEHESKLEDLRHKKKTILEDVMETETYKKAKEILERFDPEKHKQLQNPDGTPMRPRAPEGQELRRRVPPGGTPGGVATTPEGRGPGGGVRAAPGPLAPPAAGRGGPGPVRIASPPPNVNSPQLRNGKDESFANIVEGGTPLRSPLPPPPGPPMPRPILPRESSTAERLLDFLVGDGKNNRFALVCKDCKSHNGMALKEEFEFLSYRCCYCYTFNPARKQKPQAPRIEKSLRLHDDAAEADATPRRVAPAPPGDADAPRETQSAEDSRLSEDDDSLISNDSDGERSRGQASTARSRSHKKSK